MSEVAASARHHVTAMTEVDAPEPSMLRPSRN